MMPPLRHKVYSKYSSKTDNFRKTCVIRNLETCLLTLVHDTMDGILLHHFQMHRLESKFLFTARALPDSVIDTGQVCRN